MAILLKSLECRDRGMQGSSQAVDPILSQGSKPPHRLHMWTPFCLPLLQLRQRDPTWTREQIPSRISSPWDRIGHGMLTHTDTILLHAKLCITLQYRLFTGRARGCNMTMSCYIVAIAKSPLVGPKMYHSVSRGIIPVKDLPHGHCWTIVWAIA